MKKYNHYGGGRGLTFEHPLLTEYQQKIDSTFSIIDNYFSDKELKDIEKTLKLSLENGKDFYTNAPDYMKKQMEECLQLLQGGVLF